MMIMVHTTHHFFDSVVIANLRASLASNTSTSFYRNTGVSWDCICDGAGSPRLEFPVKVVA